MRIAYLYPEHLGFKPARLLQTAATLRALANTGAKVHFLVGGYAGLDQRLAELGLAGLANLAVERLPMFQPGPGARLRVSWHGLYNRAAAFRLAELARGGRFVVLLRHLKLAGHLLHRAGLPPLVYEAHEIFAQSAAENRMKPAKLAWLTELENRVLTGADRVVAISQPLARELNRRQDIRHPVAVAPSGVGEEFFRVPDTGREPGLAVYCGGLAPWKGVDLLFNALAQSKLARLAMLGGDPASADWQRLAGLAKSLGLGDRVAMSPAAGQQEVRRLLARASLAVWPGSGARRIAAEYTSPLKLFEYLAAGACVLAPDLPAANTVLSHRQNAWLFQADNAQNLAESLDHLCQNPDLAAKIAAQGRELARGYTWDKRAGVLLRVMEGLAK